MWTSVSPWSMETSPLYTAQVGPTVAQNRAQIWQTVRSLGFWFIVVTGIGADMEGMGQGLTLAHFSAQRKRFLRDRGRIEGLFRNYVAGVSGGCLGVLAV